MNTDCEEARFKHQSSTQLSERQCRRCDLHRSGRATRPSVSLGACIASTARSSASKAACADLRDCQQWPPHTPPRRNCSRHSTASSSCGRLLRSCRSASAEAQRAPWGRCSSLTAACRRYCPRSLLLLLASARTRSSIWCVGRVVIASTTPHPLRTASQLIVVISTLELYPASCAAGAEPGAAREPTAQPSLPEQPSPPTPLLPDEVRARFLNRPPPA